MDEPRQVWITSWDDSKADAARPTATSLSRLPRTESRARVTHQEQQRVQGFPHRSTQVPSTTTRTEDSLCLTTNKTTVTGRPTKSMITRGDSLGQNNSRW